MDESIIYSLIALSIVIGISAIILHFFDKTKGPQGQQGAQGPQGPQGQEGPQGEKGSGLSENQINNLNKISSVQEKLTDNMNKVLSFLRIN